MMHNDPRQWLRLEELLDRRMGPFSAERDSIDPYVIDIQIVALNGRERFVEFGSWNARRDGFHRVIVAPA